MVHVPSVLAVDWFPIVPCGSSGQAACTPCDLFKTFKNIIDLVLYGITGPIAAFMIVWAGGLMLLGGANPKLYSQGTTMLKNTLIGVSIILLSWLATSTLIKTLATGNAYDAWFEFSCPVGLSAIPPIETVLPTGGPKPVIPAATVLTPKFAGTATLADTVNLCGGDIKCPKPGSCPAQAKRTGKYPNAKLLQAIMLNESSCLVNPPPSGAGAYGIMQLKPETAARFRVQCKLTHKEKDKDGNDVDVPDEITPAWLTSEINLDKIVCVGSEFLKSLTGECGTDARNLAAGYNGGPGACKPSTDCAQVPSCSGGTMRRWECPWDNTAHTIANTGYIETRNYAPKVAVCAK